MAAHEVPIGQLEDFPDGGLVAADADGIGVIVARTADSVCVAASKCPHLNLPLIKGPGGLTFTDGVVQCAWHNSRFEVCSGKNLDWVGGFAGRSTPVWSRKLIGLGRKPKDLATFPAVVRDGQVVVTIDK
jgi:nitrite reductase/ring-hydroxylating ferredoxin subunit